MTNNFPQAYNPDIYLNLYTDLQEAGFSADQLRQHYEKHGIEEGRITNEIRSRYDFIPLIPSSAVALEIGPFYSPVIRGDNVKYFDVLSREAMIERAIAHNYPVENVPFIDFVEPTGNLDIVNKHFDIVVSSHNIEHQPDLIAHLQKVGQILVSGGFYFCMIPDKRFCFDHFIPETTIADIICRNMDKLSVHYLKSVIEHRALTTHNNPEQHWNGDHGDIDIRSIAQRIKDSINEFNEAKGSYIDVHAHFFTPQSFTRIINILNELGKINLQIIRCYHTIRNQSEFFVIFKKMQ